MRHRNLVFAIQASMIFKAVRTAAFTIALTASSLAQAGSCEEVNLTDQHQVFHGIPTFDQGGGQICYAYTAAQLVEGERVAQGHVFRREEAISPMSIALNYALANGQQNLQQGGITCHAIEAMGNRSACPSAKSFKNLDDVAIYIAQFENCRAKKSSADCLTISSKVGSARAVQLLSQSNPLFYVKAIEDQMCFEKDRIRVNIPKCEMVNEETFTADLYRAKADAVFNLRRPKPVEIGFSAHLLSYSGFPAKKYVISRKAEDDGFMFSIRYKPHSSMLLGRRLKNNKCQYLLRNSMGRSFCPSGLVQSAGWECDAKSEGIWINAKELFDATFEISYLP